MLIRPVAYTAYDWFIGVPAAAGAAAASATPDSRARHPAVRIALLSIRLIVIPLHGQPGRRYPRHGPARMSCWPGTARSVVIPRHSLPPTATLVP